MTVPYVATPVKACGPSYSIRVVYVCPHCGQAVAEKTLAQRVLLPTRCPHCLSPVEDIAMLEVVSKPREEHATTTGTCHDDPDPAEVCPYCGGRLVRDPVTRELVCQTCGTVIEDRVLVVEEPEYRIFDSHDYMTVTHYAPGRLLGTDIKLMRMSSLSKYERYRERLRARLATCRVALPEAAIDEIIQVLKRHFANCRKLPPVSKVVNIVNLLVDTSMNYRKCTLTRLESKLLRILRPVVHKYVTDSAILEKGRLLGLPVHHLSKLYHSVRMLLGPGKTTLSAASTACIILADVYQVDVRHRDIAKIFNVSEATVRSNLHTVATYCDVVRVVGWRPRPSGTLHCASPVQVMDMVRHVLTQLRQENITHILAYTEDVKTLEPAGRSLKLRLTDPTEALSKIQLHLSPKIVTSSSVKLYTAHNIVICALSRPEQVVEPPRDVETALDHVWEKGRKLLLPHMVKLKLENGKTLKEIFTALGEPPYIAYRCIKTIVVTPCGKIIQRKIEKQVLNNIRQIQTPTQQVARSSLSPF